MVVTINFVRYCVICANGGGAQGQGGVIARYVINICYKNLPIFQKIILRRHSK
jgi:hypothetical protein